MLYTRSQLRVLVALAAALLVGLGVSHWRAGFPALADRLERFDRDGPMASAVVEESAAPPAPITSPPGQTGASSGRRDRPAKARDAPTPHTSGGPVTAPDPRPLDVNTATAEQLARLPGVGPALAARIVTERERGAFESPEGLRRVLGFGPKKLALVRDLVTVSRRDVAPASPVDPGGPTPAGDDEPTMTAGPR